jgi:divalent metal cation (Fe/Co/Zn/Cd) transporter
MLFIVGLLSVIVIIYSGILYIISAGNSNTVQKAKTTLTYAVVGLIVAILSYAIVSFVVNALKK